MKVDQPLKNATNRPVNNTKNLSCSEHTEVYYLETEGEVEQFCRCLKNLKNKAPGSLKLTIAVTATRDVIFRGSGSFNLRDEVASFDIRNGGVRPSIKIRPERKSRRVLDPADRGY